MSNETKLGKPVSAETFNNVFKQDTFANIAVLLGLGQGGIPIAAPTNKAVYQAYESLALSVDYLRLLDFPSQFFLTKGDVKALFDYANEFVSFAIPPDNETNLQLLIRVCGLREAPNEFTVFPDDVTTIIRSLYNFDHYERQIESQEGISDWGCFEWLCEDGFIGNMGRGSKLWLAKKFFDLPSHHYSEYVALLDNEDNGALINKIERVYRHLYEYGQQGGAGGQLWTMLSATPERDFITAVNAIGRQDRAVMLQRVIGIEPQELAMPAFNLIAHERLSMLGAILAPHPQLGQGLTAAIRSNDKAFYEWLLEHFSKNQLRYMVGKVARCQLLMKVTGLKKEALEQKGFTPEADEQLKFFYRVLCCIQTYPGQNARQRLQWLLDNYHKPEFKNILSWMLKNNPPAASLAMKCDFFRNLLPPTEQQLRRGEGGRQGALKAMRGLLNLLGRGIAAVLMFSCIVFIGGLFFQWGGAAPMDFLKLGNYPWAASLAVHSLVLGLIISLVPVIDISLKNIKSETRADKVWAVISRLLFPLTLLLAVGQMIYTGYKDPEQNFSLRSCLLMLSKVFDRVPNMEALLTRFMTVATVAEAHDKKVGALQPPAADNKEPSPNGSLQVPQNNFAPECKEEIALTTFHKKPKNYGETDAAQPLLSNVEGMTNA